MIALMLAAQLSAAPLPAALPLDQIAPARALIQRRAPSGTCMGNVGQMEAAYARPAALYRQGDRPAKDLRRWADYPQASLCLVESGR